MYLADEALAFMEFAHARRLAGVAGCPYLPMAE